jgi:hypothetical protein
MALQQMAPRQDMTLSVVDEQVPSVLRSRWYPAGKSKKVMMSMHWGR